MKFTNKPEIYQKRNSTFQNRGATHRHVAYKKFQKLGYYTLTLDYRGYGDSIMSKELNMTSVVQDAVLALKYVL